MARNKRGKMALYEAMSKARQKPGFGRTLEHMRNQPVSEPEAEIEAGSAFVESDSGVEDSHEPAVKWTRKPSVVQVNSGRVEFSVPYPIGVAAVLGLIVVVLFAFRAGQHYVPSGAAAGEPEKKVPKAQTAEPISSELPPGTYETAGVDPEVSGSGGVKEDSVVDPRRPQSGNAVVLVEYSKQRDLMPVQKHFASNGIETEIMVENGRYFLVTKGRFDNPATPGTDGYEMIRKVGEVGAKYRGKAPEGYETFAPHYFSDAYGRKFE